MASAVRAGRAYLELFLDDDKAQRQLSAFRRKFTKTAQSLRDVGAIALGTGTAIVAPFAAALKSASDFQETLQKFNVVYGDLANDQRAWIDQFADDVGRAKSELTGFAAEFQDLLVPIGIDQQQAAEVSRTLTELTVDLASFNNLRTSDVARDLSAALTGSSEVMKKYGVVVNETAVKQRLLDDGLDPKNATEAQKSLARLNIILQGTTAAQGDALRSSGRLANQMKTLQAKIQDAAVEIGTILIPAVTDVVVAFNKSLGGIQAFIQGNENLFKNLAIAGAAITAFGAVATGLSIGFTGLAAAVSGASLAIQGLGVVLSVLTSPLTAGIAGVAALTVGIANLSDAFAGTTFISDTTQTLSDLARLLASGNISDAFKVLAIDVQIAMQRIIASVVEAIDRITRFTKLSESLDTGQVISDLRTDRESILIEAERARLKKQTADEEKRAEESQKRQAELEAQQQRIREQYTQSFSQPEESSTSPLSSVARAFDNAAGISQAIQGARAFGQDLAIASRSAADRIRDSFDVGQSQLSLSDGSPQDVSSAITRGFEIASSGSREDIEKKMLDQQDRQTKLLAEIKVALKSGKKLVFGG